MATKVDYKRDEKHLYGPGARPEIIDVPTMRFLQLDGAGDPGGADFAAAVGALYSLSYAVRMSYKSDAVPEGYYAYTIYPLEGVWDLVDRSKPVSDKSNYKYTLMIRQPEFLTDAGFAALLERTMRKKPSEHLERVRFGPVTEGLSCQALHVGPFDDEHRTFALMEGFCSQTGYRRASKLHREIYLTDVRKTGPAKARTVLRFAVSPAAP